MLGRMRRRIKPLSERTKRKLFLPAYGQVFALPGRYCQPWRTAMRFILLLMLPAILARKPMTSTQYVLELQRDWARSTTYASVTGLFKRFGGAYGIGIQYAGEVLKHQ